MIEKLFTEKLKPAVKPQAEARDAIVRQRQQIETDRQAFIKKIEDTQATVSDLERLLDEKIIAGKNPDDILVKIGTRKAEIAAYERHLQRLADQDSETEAEERAANQALSIALHVALDDLRADVQNLFEGHLNEALGVLCSFEQTGLDTAKNLAVELSKDLAVFSFAGCERLKKDLNAFLDKYEPDLSVILRREAREMFFAKQAQQQKAAA